MMIVKLVVGKELTGSDMRQAIGQAEGSFAIDRFGVRDYSAVGTEASAIISALKKYGCIGWFKSPFTVKKIDNLSTKKPAMLLVSWGTNAQGASLGAHWVVTVGVVGNKLVCLDPDYGVYEMAKTTLPTYYNGYITHIIRG